MRTNSNWPLAPPTVLHMVQATTRWQRFGAPKDGLAGYSNQTAVACGIVLGVCGPGDAAQTSCTHGLCVCVVTTVGIPCWTWSPTIWLHAQTCDAAGKCLGLGLAHVWKGGGLAIGSSGSARGAEGVALLPTIHLCLPRRQRDVGLGSGWGWGRRLGIQFVPQVGGYVLAR